MKYCPGWKKPGDPCHGWWKCEVLRHLGETFGLDTLVETGTCEGSTAKSVAPHFKTIYTSELATYYYDIAAIRLADLPNIVLLKGDSRKTLPIILDNLKGKPVLFFLDAHSSGGLTAETYPLVGELAVIVEKSPDSLIVIDDEPGPELGNVQEAGVNLDGWHREFRTGLILMHKEKYTIPEWGQPE